MVTVVIAIVLIAALPLFGLFVGLGPSRLWWLVERILLGAMWAFGAGVIAGEKLRDKFWSSKP